VGDPVAIDIQNADGTTTKVHRFGDDANAKGVCIIFPAMGVNASYYQPLATELASDNWMAFTADLRGNGNSSIRPSRQVDFSYSDSLRQDFLSVIKYVRTAFPSQRLFLFGHSLGGQLSCLFASRNEVKIDGLILSATCSVHYKGWEGLAAYRILAATQFLSAAAKLCGYLPGKKVGFGGTEAKSLIGDWSRQARTGNYVLKNDAFDYETAMKQVKLPVLAISYEGDTLCPPTAVEHLLGKLGSAQKEHIHLKKVDDRNDGFNHFSWVKKPKNIVRMVGEWVQQNP
jgi:predicted alpha/beta hydrolase